MTTAEQTALIAAAASVTRLPLRYMETIAQRRGTTVLKLQADGAQYALKYAEADHQTALLNREAQILAGLPQYSAFHIGSGQYEEVYWLLTAWQSGQNVYQAARQIHASGAKNEPMREAFRALFLKILHSIDRLHQSGYLHGDIQPSHLVMTPDEDVLLLDFGVARRIAGDDFPYRGALVYYAAPEIAAQMQTGADHIPYDLLSEIYAAAATLYVLYTNAFPINYGTNDIGALPFNDKLAAQAAGNVKTFAEAGAAPFPALEAILRHALAPERRHRCPTFSYMIEQISHLKAD